MHATRNTRTLCIGQRAAGMALCLAFSVLTGVPARAQPQPAADPGAQVYTRAQVRSLPSAKAGEGAMLRLKLAPGGKIPFSTIAFDVRDPALLQGLAVGDDVAFRAGRIDGRNVVVALRKVAPCVRFQPCPVITD